MSSCHIYEYLKELTSSLLSFPKSGTISHYDLLENTDEIQLANITIFSNDDYYVDNNVNNDGNDDIIITRANPSIKIDKKNY